MIGGLMRIRIAAAAGLLLLTQAAPLAAQRTGDQARLVFTISGSVLDSKGLWAVSGQNADFGLGQGTVDLARSIGSNFGASLAGSYFPKSRIGLTAEALVIDFGYNDSCRASPNGSPTVQQACEDINVRGRSAAAIAVSVGGIFRVASREFISPFARIGAGVLVTNQSSLLMQGQADDGSFVFLYDDETRTRVRPALQIGVGTTVVLGRGYHLRAEVRDNIMGVVRATGPTPALGDIPPHETTYKHLFGVMIGLDVILERSRGRRY
jgi:hypothetical protein